MRPFFVLLLAAVISVKAQPPQVPHKMEFAGMTLTIRDDARKEIQKDVNALTQSPRHHNMKVERAKTYFPLIEKVFEEERVPEDFKYLVLQESALIADAVSVSNAVGFWQFKDYTAVEMGLRVDKEIDERLNIVSSSRAAARYIKKNNFYFNNWLFALQAYQMGAGGAMKALPKNLSGARQMDITSNTYWYVKKFLAHKVAFENDVNGAGSIKAIPYENKSKKLLAELAKEISVSEDDLKSYNKWAKLGRIPDDRTYTVIIPAIGDVTDIKLPATTVAIEEPSKDVSETIAAVEPAVRIKINGIKAIKASAGDTPSSIAARADVKVSDFIAWNDIDRNTTIKPQFYYLLGKKRSQGDEAYHVVSPGEDLWDISQKHGVQIKKLRRYNRLSSNEQVKTGSTLWLASKKPKGGDKEAVQEVIEIDNSTTFAWTATPERNSTAGQPDVTGSPSDAGTSVDSPVALNNVQIMEDSARNHVDSTQTLQLSATIGAMPDSTLADTEKISITTGKQKEHIVQPKETLYAIAHTYNVGVMDLVGWNNLNIQDGIRPGQILKLSDGQNVGGDIVGRVAIEHEVKTTDTLYSIARKYGVTIKDLMEWNNKKDFSLAVGEKLKIQGK